MAAHNFGEYGTEIDIERFDKAIQEILSFGSKDGSGDIYSQTASGASTEIVTAFDPVSHEQIKTSRSPQSSNMKFKNFGNRNNGSSDSILLDPMNYQNPPSKTTLKGDSCETVMKCNKTPKHRKIKDTVEDKRIEAYKCTICNKILGSKSSLTIHSLTHTNERPFKCEFCEFHSVRRDSLKRHLIAIHNIPATGTVLLCSFCHKWFPSYVLLHKHIQSHTGYKRRAYQCTICNKILSSKESLKDHSLIHTNERPFKCEFCEFDSVRKQSLKRHLVAKHNIPATGLLCSVCHKGFPNSELLQNHIQSRMEHKCIETYQCTVCHKVLSSKHSLRDHSLIHTKERPFKCEFCEHNFIKKQNLKKHLVDMHNMTAVGPLHECSVCHKLFPNSDLLQNHIQSHTENSPL